MIYYLDIKLDDITAKELDILTENDDFFFIKEVDKSEFGDEEMWKVEKNSGRVQYFDYMSYIEYEVDNLVKETTKEKFIEHFRLLGLMSA